MPFNGLGFSGGGFGQAQSNAAPLNQYLGDSTGAGSGTSQANGVAAYGAVWASKNCTGCNTAILEMQGQINRVARAIGTPGGLSSDGKVGAGTVAALQAIAMYAMQRGAPVGMVLAVYNTPELVAKNADKIRDFVRQLADSVSAPTTAQSGAPTTTSTPPTSTAVVATTTSPGSGAGAGLPTTIPGMENYMTPASPWKARLPWIIGGGILLTGLVVAGLILHSPQKHSE